MMLRYVYYALWVATAPLFVCLAAVMVRRTLHKQMPAFFAFVALQVADFLIGFYSYHRSQVEYFCIYWTLAAIGAGLSFGILYEIFSAVFRPFLGLRELGAILFRWAALVLAVAALLLALNSRAIPGGPAAAVIVNCIRSVEVMQCGLVLLMLLCTNYLGITLKHRVFGIALGFGLNAAVDLIAVGAFANLGWEASTFFQLSRMATFILSALLWLAYVHSGVVECRPTKKVAYAERWDFALAAAMNPGQDSPALPLIENVVERVWKQSNGHPKAGASYSASQ